jgi:uncharacterized protein with von Willebrand factor type A (vWA) domain
MKLCQQEQWTFQRRRTEKNRIATRAHSESRSPTNELIEHLGEESETRAEAHDHQSDWISGGGRRQDAPAVAKAPVTGVIGEHKREIIFDHIVVLCTLRSQRLLVLHGGEGDW